MLLLDVLPKEKATYTNLRIAAANFIHSHPTDFIPFLPSAGGEDGEGALDAGFMNRQQFEGYCTMVRDTAVWGGEPEIVALSKAFNLPIHVVQGSQPFVVVHDPTGDQSHAHSKVKRVIQISYHRKLYGLGEVSEHQAHLHPFIKRLPTPALQFFETNIQNFTNLRALQKHFLTHPEYYLLIIIHPYTYTGSPYTLYHVKLMQIYKVTKTRDHLRRGAALHLC